MATDLRLVVVTLAGNEYVLFKPKTGGDWAFPSDAFRPGEAPGAAAKRVVAAWTGTKDPKLEILDFRAGPGALAFVFRALLTEDPRAGEAASELKRTPRMGLPDRVGDLTGREVEEIQKTGLNYKLTRG